MSYISAVMDRGVQDMKPGMIKVGIVDDNKATVSSLCEVMAYSKKVQVCLTARSGDELLEKLKHLETSALPDVMITDVNMPGINGIEVVRRGKALYPGIRFVMLTVFDDEDTLFEAIKAGASGYLLKEERASNILAHLENIMEEGTAPMSSRIARKTLDLLAHSSKPVSGSDVIELEGLSAREKDVLYLLVDGLEYKEIATRLGISPHTVRTHIANVYEKLHISSKTQAIRLVQGKKIRPDQIDTQKLRILLVDDHEMILDSLSMMISLLPEFEIIGKLSDPTLVLNFLTLHPVDLIVTDINMPRLDGLSLVSQVKSLYPAIKILMLTVSEGHDHVSRAKAMGVEGYLSKKANKDELTKALRTISAGGLWYGEGLSVS